MHYNLRTALDEMARASLRVHEEMQNLRPGDIKTAFANNGYDDMLPISCRFELVNDSGQYVYNCSWNDDDNCVHFAKCFVSIAVDKLLADV